MDATDRLREIWDVYQVAKNPAWFDISYMGDVLTIRPTDDGMYQVEWCTCECKGGRAFSGPLAASIFFCHQRHQMRIGSDYDTQALTEALQMH